MFCPSLTKKYKHINSLKEDSKHDNKRADKDRSQRRI